MCSRAQASSFAELGVPPFYGRVGVAVIMAHWWAFIWLYVFVAAAPLAGVQAAGPDAAGEPWDEANSWVFDPPQDRFTDEALLDLRHLNEPQSGQHGFIGLSASRDSFVDGRGKPIRFWAVGSEVYRLSPDDMDRHCRFLAKLGVNLVRLHVTVADTREGAAITDVDQEVIDGVFRFIKAAKQNGIYLIISPYYGHHDTPRSWKLAGYSKSGAEPWGAIFIDPRMQAAFREWTRRLYTEVNPHTRLAIKNDPTVAVLQIQNEDSLFFWTTQRLPEEQSSQLRALFAEWLTRRYGGIRHALELWDGAGHPGDDIGAGIAGLYDTFALTQEHHGSVAQRIRDQVQFMAELQRSFYADMGDYLRNELGCRQLLNATNWRTANDERLKALERWTYGALEIDAENEYYGSDYQHIGENNGYRIDPGHFLINESSLHKPLELTTNFVCGVGRPFVVTETSWKRPNLYQSEGPFLVSAYQSLGGVDAVCWFVATDTTWRLDPRKLFWPVGESHAIDKWTCSTPMLMGMFPAAALAFRRGDIDEGPVVAHESRRLDDVFARMPPQLDDNEIYGVSRETRELASARRPDGRPSRGVFLMGRVTSQFTDDHASDTLLYSPEKYQSFVDEENGIVRSATGQLQWNYKQGVCTVNSPRMQGVTGFLKSAGGRFELADVTVESEDHYASISIVSYDGDTLRDSRRILIQVGTTERLTDWKTERSTIAFNDLTLQGAKIVHAGRPPLRIANSHVKISITNSKVDKCIVLDAGGYASRTLSVERTDRGVTFQFPPDALYVTVQTSDRP